jgi:hypothetical protein
MRRRCARVGLSSEEPPLSDSNVCHFNARFASHSSAYRIYLSNACLASHWAMMLSRSERFAGGELAGVASPRLADVVSRLSLDRRASSSVCIEHSR